MATVPPAPERLSAVPALRPRVPLGRYVVSGPSGERWDVEARDVFAAVEAARRRYPRADQLPRWTLDARLASEGPER